MRSRIVMLLTAVFSLVLVGSGEAQIRWINELSGPGAFVGPELRLYDHEVGGDDGPVYLNPFMSGPDQGDGAQFRVVFDTSILAGRNNVQGGSGDVVWWGFDPAIEAWSDEFGGFRVAAAAGLSINRLFVFGETEDFTKAGTLFRLMARIPVGTANVDIGYQPVVMFDEFTPQDFGSTDPTAEPFERVVHGAFLRLRIGM